ncbi:PREDICTED: uncharacterized protein LOC109218551 [Nicotiana attenuata]|uniref:uncharacterized protein LOC109218551 n=1 Tax=Nicotiana attenuata TaxID=49451 RepID=UPI0009054EC1|nr:PREDICTED: uncharacterized protein LOC109218551 [Nicotiana attenuata]
MVTVISVLFVCAAKRWHIHQKDVYTAFLQGDLFDEIYMEFPPRFKSHGESHAVYDMLVTSTSLQLIEETKTALQQTFQIKDLGELKYFLGIEFARSEKGILMHQRIYALELISELGLGAAKIAKTPLEMNARLITQEYDDHLKTQESAEDELLLDLGAYQRLIGKLLYLTVTRPDLAFCVQTLSQFLQQPKRSHMEATMRIVRYVKNHPGQGGLLSSNNKGTLEAYYDAD